MARPAVAAARAVDDARFARSNKEHYVEHVDGLDWRSFDIDPRIQRDVIPRQIKEIVTGFNPDALGTFTLSVRDVPNPTGKGYTTKWFLVDGQQRHGALTELQWDGTVHAIVHYNLTEAEEAALFLLLNTRTPVNPWDKYKARLIAEEPQAKAIQAILDDLGIALGGLTGFSAIARADRIYAKGPKGAGNLRWALQILKDVYGRYDGRVMEALAMVHDEHGRFVDAERMRTKLESSAPRISQLTGQGNVVQQLYHCTTALAVAEVIIGHYNKHTRRDGSRSTHALPSLINRRLKPSLRDREALAGEAALADEVFSPDDYADTEEETED